MFWEQRVFFQKVPVANRIATTKNVKVALWFVVLNLLDTSFEPAPVVEVFAIQSEVPVNFQGVPPKTLRAYLVFAVQTLSLVNRVVLRHTLTAIEFLTIIARNRVPDYKPAYVTNEILVHVTSEKYRVET